jgi:sugar lactone lactonase YvrE
MLNRIYASNLSQGSIVFRAGLIALFMAAGCSGHGSTVSAPIPQPPAGVPTTPSATQVQFRIAIPSKTTPSASRRLQYVSASTKSAVVSVAPGSAAAVTVNCTTVCQGNIGAPIGTDTFTVKLFDGTNGTGNLLSTGTLSFNVLIDVDNTINMTFNGVVAAVAVTVSPSAATFGQAQTSSVTVNALDADGNIIVAPGVYVNASGTPVTIALTNSDTSGHTVLSVTHVTQPTAGITLTYDGNSYVSPTITGTASGLAPANGSLTVNCRAAATTTALYTDGFSDTGVQTLDRYPLNASGDGVTPTATASLAIEATAYASGLALDAAGTLYANGIVQVAASPATFDIVVQTWCANVTGSPPPRTTFIEPPNEDGELALDANANVYSTTFNPDSTFSVFEMAANSGAPSTSVTTASTPTPTLKSFVATAPVKFQLIPSIAVDPSGNVFAGLDSVINEYAANPIGTNPSPARSISSLTATGLITPISTAVDPSGNVFVLYQNDQRTTFPGGYAVAEFAAAAPTTPALVIEGPATQIGTYLGNPPGTVNSSAVSIAVDAHDNIFVLERATNDTTSPITGEASVQEFTAGSSGNVAPATTVDLTGSAVVPNDLAVDASDNLYISDAGSFIAGGSWYEYTLGGTRVRTLAGNAPGGSSTYDNIAVDSSGNVAVTDYDGAPSGNIFFFGTAQTGNAAPARTLAVSDVLFVQQLGFDSSGNLYVLRSENQFNTIFISVFETSAARAQGLAAGRESARPRGAANARPVAVRRSIAGGRNVRSTKKKPQFAEPPTLGGPSSPGPMVSVYASTASGNAAPIRTFTDQFTFDSESDGMAVSPAGVTYVSSRFGNAVYEYNTTASTANAAPTQAYWTFGPSTALPQIATDSSGNLYVVSGGSNSISVFPPGSTTPSRTIFGPHTLLSAPGKPVIDAAGELFVLDFDLNAVLVFGPGESGDTPPARMLSQTDVASRQVNSIAIGPGALVAPFAKKRSGHRP